MNRRQQNAFTLRSPAQQWWATTGLAMLVSIISSPSVGLAADASRALPMDLLGRLEIEDLATIDVSVRTVAGTGQNILHTPAAISVISARDIRRSGHHTIAEALRLAPGQFVGRSASHTWRVGTRGLSGGLANKNLVLIDGRSVWDPLFGGVFWDVQDTVIEDIDRIEVIRGPGATLWGANAMNGVINVVTKPAQDTQGWYADGGVGTYEQSFGTLRYGGTLSDNAWFRVFTKYVNRDSFIDDEGQSTQDDWSIVRGGFRLDALPSHGLAYTVQGDAYGSLKMGEVTAVPIGPGAQELRAGKRNVSGGNLLARVSHQATSGSGWTLQSYYDRTQRHQSAGLDVSRDTLDLDFRHSLAWGEGHDFIWGVGYNFTTDRVKQGPTVIFEPHSRSQSTTTAFAQNTLTLQPERWFLMLGSKVGYHTFTGFEIQPNARLWFTPGVHHMFWASISRPVRLPSRTEKDAFLILALTDPEDSGQPFVPVGVSGGGDLDAERMAAYELGHRFRPTSRLRVDTSLYVNDYSRLIFVPETIIGSRFDNLGTARTYGGEVELNWSVADNWRVTGGYGFTHIQVRGPILRTEEKTHPRHIGHLRSFIDITGELELNTAIYYVDRIKQADAPSYLRLDVGLAWRPVPTFEISAWGQNLLHSSHREDSFREFERGFYLRGTLRY